MYRFVADFYKLPFSNSLIFLHFHYYMKGMPSLMIPTYALVSNYVVLSPVLGTNAKMN